MAVSQNKQIQHVTAHDWEYDTREVYTSRVSYFPDGPGLLEARSCYFIRAKSASAAMDPNAPHCPACTMRCMSDLASASCPLPSM